MVTMFARIAAATARRRFSTDTSAVAEKSAFSWLSPSGREIGTAISVLAVVFSLGAGATRLLFHKDAAVAALEERMAALHREHAAQLGRCSATRCAPSHSRP
jgi:hypothetical protein